MLRAELRDLWERALAGSPVAQTISRPTPVVAVLEVVDGEGAS
ncbi:MULTISPECIES: hypothetical protein [unclassified Streptomyces]|nr:hypothetical protein OG279_38515 [Streptomyces sp. NBC_01201]